jgi:DNA-binding NarL/FixJ family response regulator
MKGHIGGQATKPVVEPTVDTMRELPVRVLIADNHDDVLHATSDLVSEFPEAEVVSLATDVDSTILLVEQLKPDLVLVDAWLKGGGAEEASSRIRAVAPETAVAVVTSTTEVELEQRLRAAGGLGFFEKEHLVDTLPGILKSARRKK